MHTSAPAMQRHTRAAEGLVLLWEPLPDVLRYGAVIGMPDLTPPSLEAIVGGKTRAFAILGIPARFTAAVDVGSPVDQERQFGLVAYRSDGTIVAVPTLRCLPARQAPRDRPFHLLQPPLLQHDPTLAPAHEIAPLPAHEIAPLPAHDPPPEQRSREALWEPSEEPSYGETVETSAPTPAPDPWATPEPAAPHASPVEFAAPIAPDPAPERDPSPDADRALDDAPLASPEPAVSAPVSTRMAPTAVDASSDTSAPLPAVTGDTGIGGAPPGSAERRVAERDGDPGRRLVGTAPDPLAEPAPVGKEPATGSADPAAASTALPPDAARTGAPPRWADAGTSEPEQGPGPRTEPMLAPEPARASGRQPDAPPQVAAAAPTGPPPAAGPAAAPPAGDLAALLDEAELYLAPQWSDRDAAARLLDQASSLAPGDARVLALRAHLDAAAADTGDDAQGDLVEAARLLDAERFWDAVDLYEEVLTRQPDNEAARAGLTRARLLARWQAQRSGAGTDPVRLLALADTFSAAPDLAAQAFAASFEARPSAQALAGQVRALLASARGAAPAEAMRRGIASLRECGVLGADPAVDIALAGIADVAGTQVGPALDPLLAILDALATGGARA